MNLIIWSIAVVTITTVINVFVMSRIQVELFKEILNHYDKYLKRFVLSESILQGVLEGRNKQRLLGLFLKTQKEIEELEE